MLILFRDEILYQARLHPEQYSNTFSDEQIKRLHDAIMYVCNTAVDTLGESDKFPEDWLMLHRWGKGKKDGGRLPNGAKITFLKVGGRTSAIVPSIQKKTGAVAGDVSQDANGLEGGADEELQPEKGTKRKSKLMKEETDDAQDAEEGVKTSAPASANRGRKKVEEDAPVSKKLKKAVKEEDGSERRRSGRLSKS